MMLRSSTTLIVLFGLGQSDTVMLVVDFDEFSSYGDDGVIAQCSGLLTATMGQPLLYTDIAMMLLRTCAAIGPYTWFRI